MMESTEKIILPKEKQEKILEKVKDFVRRTLDDDFKIPHDWKLHLKSDFYVVYNITEIENILIQYWLCRKSDYTDPQKQKIVENRGVPFKLQKSKNRFIYILDKA